MRLRYTTLHIRCFFPYCTAMCIRPCEHTPRLVASEGQVLSRERDTHSAPIQHAAASEAQHNRVTRRCNHSTNIAWTVQIVSIRGGYRRSAASSVIIGENRGCGDHEDEQQSNRAAMRRRRHRVHSPPVPIVAGRGKRKQRPTL